MVVINKFFSKDRYQAIYLVEKEEDGLRLDQFVQNYMNRYSRQEIKRKISKNEVQISGRRGPHRPSAKVHEGEEVTITTLNNMDDQEIWRGEPLPLIREPNVIYEDNDLIVISKPPFMSTHPAGKHLFHCATVFFETIHSKTIHSIHRIDRETSGILLLGKNPQSAQKYSSAFENNIVSKCYFFIAHKTDTYDGTLSFRVNLRLGQEDEGLKRVVVLAYPQDSNQGKHAITQFEIIEDKNDYVFGLAFPITGRQHQIRVHAAESGLPLVGDKIYRGGYPLFQRFKDGIQSDHDYDLMEIPRHALHAIAIKIPDGHSSKIFIDSIPDDLKNWIAKKWPQDEIEKLQEKIKETSLYWLDRIKASN